MSSSNRKSSSLIGFATRHRVAVAMLLVFLTAQPATPDDRQLLRATAGANTNVLLILDSSHSMNADFSDRFHLPAYMDDFLYPQGTFTVVGSKIGVAKSVLRQVLTTASGVNWSFAYYRNPNQTFGAAQTVPGTGVAVGGARTSGQLLENGGLEWLYFVRDDVSSVLAADDYPDVQQGRFVQFGHKVPRPYVRFNAPVSSSTTEIADIRPPYSLPVGVSSGPPAEPYSGEFRGAFGPKAFDTTLGSGQGMVVYRNPAKPGFELRLKVVSGNYSDPTIQVLIEEWSPPPTSTATATNTFTPTNTPTPTFTATNTVTFTPSPTQTPTFTQTFTPTNTFTITNTFTQTPTFTQTFTVTNTATITPTFTQTFTPSNTPRPTRTFTPTSTPSPTITPTSTITPTFTQSPTITQTFTITPTPLPPTATPSFTQSMTPSRTNTFTRTPTITQTRTRTQTPTVTNTVPSNTPTLSPTITNTPRFTNTPSRTPIPPTNTFTLTLTPTNTPTITLTATATPTITNTFTKTNTPVPTNTFTQTSTNTPTNTPTKTFTFTATNTPTNTPTFTPTFTPTNTPTFTKTLPPTRTPTPVPPTPSGGLIPAGSLLPAAAAWMSPAVRGVLAMAPPPPLLSPAPVPCPGVPAALNSGSAGPILCGACGWDTTKLCAFTDPLGLGDTDFFQYVGDPSSWFITAYDPSYRGFDDPQADPGNGPGMFLKNSVVVTFQRADLFDLGGGLGTYFADDTVTGNPPWGSQPPNDMDADGTPDPIALTNRQNQGAYSALYELDAYNQVLGRPDPYAQQFPSDAFGEPSCSGAFNPCNVYLQDCGGMAKYTTNGPAGYVPYPSVPPASTADWPVIPLPRDWIPGDAPSVPAIKRLLRFTSAVVNYDFTAPHMTEYSLAENANDVVVTAPGTPIAGVLKDAYNYFKNAVFTELDDPSINCRNHLIVYLTDGLDECNSNACAGGPTGKGPSGDLGVLPLPENPVGARAQAHALDSSVRLAGVPVYVVALGLDPTDPVFQCIATNTGGKVFGATDRATLKAALESILDFKSNPNFFSAPAVPAFASGFGDTAQIGAVIPSHLNDDLSLSQWAIWSGYLKSFKLDSSGNVPVVTANPLAPTATPTPGGPTATPVVATPTPTPPVLILTYPDEETPNDASVLTRRPVWNAARVLGYTDPVASLTENKPPAPASPGAKAPEIDVWPGRKLLWATGAGGTAVPLARRELMPNTAPCTGACFLNLVSAMGLSPLSAVDRASTGKTVQFLRGGISAFGARDEVLNTIPAYSAIPVGPGPGQQQRWSYFYQDDPPAPGQPPQFRTDGEASPKGYSHKLGDIFHSEPTVVEPPRYFQYLSANLAPNGKPYSSFVALHTKRRKIVYVGSNDGLMHGFDAGVWGRDTTNFPNSHDLGTGREIFGYALSGLMKNNFPNLLRFPPAPQYFMDGSFGSADVFTDANFAVAPVNASRAWRSILVGTTRQGGKWVYALDVTYPDAIETNSALPTFGEITIGKDNSPGCLDGGGAGCPTSYPQILWELTDDCTVQPTTCALPTYAKMGETWSKPVVGRIKILNSGTPEDRYVAIFGGGDDPTFNPLDTVLDADQVVAPFKKATRGRAFYIVDVETGKIIYKAVAGVNGSGTSVKFAPMPAAPALVDYNDNGYFDLAYIGDINGQMWRIDLTPDATGAGPCPTCPTTPRGVLSGGLVTGYQPFMLFHTDPATSPQKNQPIFLEAGIIYLAGGTRPTLGVAFGTGNRRELAQPNVSVNRFYFVVDTGQGTTANEDNLRDITPEVGASGVAGVGPGGSDSGCVTAPCTGFFLDFQTANEKTTSTVYSTQGFLSLITFTPDASNPCSTEGSSFRYRFFFLNGIGGYNPTGPQNVYTAYRQNLGQGLSSGSQSTSPNGNTIDTVLFSGGAVNQQNTPGSLNTINVNWKELQQ